MLTPFLNNNPEEPSPIPPQQTRTLASKFSYGELADIYNQTRVDYIVPMPMNARYMQQYVEQYDIRLDASVISSYGEEISGIAMLGVRGDRAWITRLGVVPEMRGKKVASFLVDCLMRKAQMNGVRTIQLEVIKGNDPALRLFEKYGFTFTRKLAVIRRPPAAIAPEHHLPDCLISALTSAEITDCLNRRPDGASWVDETPSMLQLGELAGYRLETPTGAWGWIVFHQNRFQLSHFVMDTCEGLYEPVARTLLTHVHHSHPLKDTKIENVPVNHPALSLFLDLGYLESFRRVEMTLTL